MNSRNRKRIIFVNSFPGMLVSKFLNIILAAKMNSSSWINPRKKKFNALYMENESLFLRAINDTVTRVIRI